MFQKCETQNSARSVQFKGLAVPGAVFLNATDDLVAIWKNASGQRFQNYKASFTILDVPIISRQWIENLENDNPFTKVAPPNWSKWINHGVYTPLIALRTTYIRSVNDQLPSSRNELEMLKILYEHFSEDPHLFEYFAAKIFSMSDKRVIIDEVTRSVVDGGKDALGRYKIGVDSDPIYVEFALEAKCYNPGLEKSNRTTVGVKETSRLISRIRNRQFGVLVTTSVVGVNAYEEIRKDGHPINLITGGDITRILVSVGRNDVYNLRRWLADEYPIN